MKSCIFRGLTFKLKKWTAMFLFYVQDIPFSSEASYRCWFSSDNTYSTLYCIICWYQAWVKFNNDSTLLCCPFTGKLLEIVNPTNGDWFHPVKLSKLVKMNVIFWWLKGEIGAVISELRLVTRVKPRIQVAFKQGKSLLVRILFRICSFSSLKNFKFPAHLRPL